MEFQKSLISALVSGIGLTIGWLIGSYFFTEEPIDGSFIVFFFIFATLFYFVAMYVLDIEMI